MKRFSTLFALSLWFILAAIGIVFAADTPTTLAPVAASPAPAAVALFLQGTVFPIIGSFLLGILSIFLNRLGNKYKIDALTQRNNLIERAAFQGITLAEEKAAQYIANQQSFSGSAKLEIAVAHVLSVIPSVSAEQAEAITESLLARISGIGATKDSAITLNPAAA